MKIGTQNKLAHYQCEYRELYEQTMMLQNQVAPLQAQISQLQQYCAVNNGDRRQMTELRKSIQRLNTLSNTIKRNQMRMVTLQRQITTESNRIMMQQQKAQMQLANGGCRGRRRYY